MSADRIGPYILTCHLTKFRVMTLLRTFFKVQIVSLKTDKTIHGGMILGIFGEKELMKNTAAGHYR